MEEKLAKLFIIINEFSDKSEKYYIEFDFSGDNKEIELSVRNKETYEYIQTIRVFLQNANYTKLDELIEFVKNYKD